LGLLAAAAVVNAVSRSEFSSNGVGKFEGKGWGVDKEMRMKAKKMKLIARRPGLSRNGPKPNFLTMLLI